MSYPWVRICLLLFKWEKQTLEAENSHLKKKKNWDIFKKGILKAQWKCLREMERVGDWLRVMDILAIWEQKLR